MHRARFFVSPLLGFILLAAALSPAALRADDPTRLERWQSEIRELEEDSRVDAEDSERKVARQAKRTGRKAERLWVDMRQRGWREPRLPGLLAELATVLAIAELNRGGEQARAAWLYSSALLLDESVAERDWSVYGRAGRILSEVELRPFGQSPPGSRALTRPFPIGGRFERPQPGPAEEVEVPLNRGARHDRGFTRPVLEVVIHDDGSVSHPRIAVGHRAKPTVLLGVLDMVWTMAPCTPGRLDGEPVAVIYEVEVEEFIFDRWYEMQVIH